MTEAFATMHAVHQAGYGEPDAVLSIRTVPRPELPAGRPNTVLVRVAAVSVAAGDVIVVRGYPYGVRAFVGGLRTPALPCQGLDFSGQVVAVGAGVTRFAIGDAVFGVVGPNAGAFAEFVVADESLLVRKPARITFEQAAAVPTSAMTALQALRIARPTAPGDRVLVNGASGGVGHFCVQLAKAAGAHVTAVCNSQNVETIRALGADEVIDYSKASFVAPTGSAPARYDRIVDLVANRSLADCSRVLARGGVFVSAGGRLSDWGFLMRLLSLLWASWRTQHQHSFCNLLMQPALADLEELSTLLADGKLVPLVGRSFETVSQIPAALAYQATGRAVGKTVVTVLQA